MTTRLRAFAARRSLTNLSQPKDIATIAVIGTGWWSQGWHLPHLSKNQKIKLVVVDQNPQPKSNLNPDLEPLSNLADRYGAPFFNSTEDLLADPVLGPTLDGALVATPHASHFKIGEVLLREGMRRKRDAKNNDYRPINILMEKPMTTNVDEGKNMHDVRFNSLPLVFATFH